jgi:hypothetical protein
MNRSSRLAAAFALAGLLCGGGAMWAFRAVPAPAGPATATEPAPSATEIAELETAAQRSEKISKPTLDALARNLPAFSFNGTLEHGLAKFADRAKLHLWIDWRAIEATGIEKNAPIAVDIADVSAQTTLERLLDAAGANTAALAFTVADNQVVIAPKDVLSTGRYIQTRVYDIGFYLVETATADRARKAAELVDLLESAVDEPSWREKGGTAGSTRVFETLLLVQQTRENHLAIRDLLLQLKTQRLHRTRGYDVHDLLPPAAAKSRDEQQKDAAELLAAIEANCGRGNWNDGGVDCTGAFFNGKLYITAPDDVHDQIQHLLALMRQK